MEITNCRSFRSDSLNSSGIRILPVFSHSSAGASTGIDISWPPIAFISSLMTWTIRSWIRHPAGR
jgi:hypothetical protein